MPIPAILAVLGKVFGAASAAKGLSETERQDNKLDFESRRQGSQPATVGDVTGQQSPPPARDQMPTQQGGGWNRFQNGANKAMTIASILSSLRGNDSRQGPYQMQFSRRR